MSITQISKIQLRRGKEQDLPQLASAEMGWAIDSQALFIGNGAVAEGAPAIGNTKILTEHDNIVEIANNYQYTRDPRFPKRVLSDRLDDLATSSSLGIVDSVTFQYALDKLDGNNAILHFLPGTYHFDTVVTIPSGITITGAGIGNTVLQFTSDQALIFIDQADGCHISNLTIRQAVTNYKGEYSSTTLYQVGDVVSYASAGEIVFGTYTAITSGSTPTITHNKGIIELNSTTNSKFIDIEIDFYAKIVGFDRLKSNSSIMCNSISSIVNCQNNTFERVKFSYSKNGIYSKSSSYVNDNVINNCHFDLVDNAIKLTGYSNRNKISNNHFSEITNRSIDISNGTLNSLHNNTYIRSLSVGLPPVYFGQSGNSIINDNVDREIPISEGIGIGYEHQFVESYTLPVTSIDTHLSYLPFVLGTGIKIEYTLSGDIAFRKGQILILVDKNSNIKLSDEYDYYGTTSVYADDDDSNDPITTVQFKAVKEGNQLVNPSFYQLNLQYQSNASESLTITYNYRFL